jgi:hypothetical protein
MYDLVGSVVVFKNDRAVLKRAIDSFLAVDLKSHLYVIDNSPTDALREVCSGENIGYIFNHKNLGFGAGHNIALRKTIGTTKYSLILNPDVYFAKGTVEKIFSFMEQNPDLGSVMPKVLFPDGGLQYLCRLLPDPYDILLRKIDIKILNLLFNFRKSRYELKFADYNRIMDVPYLSGCFMFVRTENFKQSGIFDERFRLYFEDIDLARRMHKLYRTVYYPEAVIYHNYARGSNKEIALLKQLISSGLKYFNKWGWFFDRDRASVNRDIKRVYQS